MSKPVVGTDPDWAKATCGECAWATTWRVIKYNDFEQNATDPHASCRYAKLDVFADERACHAFTRRPKHV